MHTEWQGVEFTRETSCRDYDWLVVYDELPKSYAKELLACPRERTILVTQEPQIIKIHSPAYVRQFGYVLTTVDPTYIKHPHYRRGCGCLVWYSGHTLADAAKFPEFEKTELVSAICARKLMKHTEHYKRQMLFEYLHEHLEGFVWRGKGINPLNCKREAMDSFKYHVVVENTVQPWHWSEKVADAFICQCLLFYCGDPELAKVLPPESFITIPAENPEESCRIIREAIANNEYEKRLPAIREARRLLVERYNLYSQILEVVADHERAGMQESAPGGYIYRRHRLRRNPWYLLEEGLLLLRARLLSKLKK